MIIQFRQWLESHGKNYSNWYDFERSRGKTHIGGVGTGRSMELPIPSVSDDRSMDIYSTHGVEYGHGDLSEIKILHDRILDSEMIKPKDLSYFVQLIARNYPVSNSDRSDYTRVELSNLATALNQSGSVEINRHIAAIAARLNHEDMLPKKAKYLRSSLDLLKNLLRNMKITNHSYADETNKKRIANKIYDRTANYYGPDVLSSGIDDTSDPSDYY